MFRKLRSHLTYANVISTLCLFLLLGGGTAYAVDTVFSSDIKDGEVMTPDLASGSVNNTKVANSAVNSGKVQDGTLQPKDLALGAAAKGSGVLDKPCISSNNCPLFRNHNVTSVRRPSDGEYCIQITGADPATDTIIAGPSAGVASFRVGANNSKSSDECNKSDFEIVTLSEPGGVSNLVPFWFAVL
jgi:hypothetical protein